MTEHVSCNSNIGVTTQDTVKGTSPVLDFSDNEDDRASVTSTKSECLMGVTAEKVCSSLSMASKGSKIPLFQRTCSLRDGTRRSASFSSSRGMTGLGSPLGYGHSLATGRGKGFYTPEMTRRITSYISPYSKKAIMADRKYQKPLDPLLIGKSSHINVGAQAQLDDDDTESVKSFVSTSSAASCDATCHSKGIYVGNGRPKNVLHCRHTTKDEPDEYLTPTQRAVRKIRELQGRIKQAHREIAERDCKIASLTRELVEYRFLKTEENEEFRESFDSPDNTGMKRSYVNSPTLTTNRRKLSFKDVNAELKQKSFSTRGLRNTSGSPGSHVLSTSPPSDGSEPELRALTDSSLNGVPSRQKEGLIRSPSADSPGVDSHGSGDLSRSIADSGHFDEATSPCLSSKDSFTAMSRTNVRKSIRTIDGDDIDQTSMLWEAIGSAKERVKVDYERRMEELKMNQMNEYHELKEKHNDHVENLLSKLSDANLRYFELRPQIEKAHEKIRDLERARNKLKEEIFESEARHQKIYLQMYIKGQQAAKFEAEQENAHRSNSSHRAETSHNDPYKCLDNLEFPNNSVDGLAFGLTKQLAEAEEEIMKLKNSYNCETNRSKRSGKNNLGRPEEIDPEITLQFLKSAIYYFLTDKDNSQGHLRAIQSILGYSSKEKNNISRLARV